MNTFKEKWLPFLEDLRDKLEKESWILGGGWEMTFLDQEKFEEFMSDFKELGGG